MELENSFCLQSPPHKCSLFITARAVFLKHKYPSEALQVTPRALCMLRSSTQALRDLAPGLLPQLHLLSLSCADSLTLAMQDIAGSRLCVLPRSAHECPPGQASPLPPTAFQITPLLKAGHPLACKLIKGRN